MSNFMSSYILSLKCIFQTASWSDYNFTWNGAQIVTGCGLWANKTFVKWVPGCLFKPGFIIISVLLAYGLVSGAIVA